MSEMIERVAREVQWEYADMKGHILSTEHGRRFVVRVLQGIQEPTKEMLIAARFWSAAKYGRPIGNDAAIGCFKAMIAAALVNQEAAR